MKKLKMHLIVLGIAISTFTTQIHAMDEERERSNPTSALTAIGGVATTIGLNLFVGARRMVYGHAPELESEVLLQLSQPDLIVTPDPIARANKVNRAFPELVGDPRRAMSLLINLNDYNYLHRDRQYDISEVARSYVKGPIEQHYKLNELAAITDIEEKLRSWFIQCKRAYEAIIAESARRESDLQKMAEAVVLVHGSKPDLEKLARTLNENRRLPLDLVKQIEARDDSFDVVDASGAAAPAPRSSSPSSSSSSASSNAALDKSPRIMAQPADVHVHSPLRLDHDDDDDDDGDGDGDHTDVGPPLALAASLPSSTSSSLIAAKKHKKKKKKRDEKEEKRDEKEYE